MFPVTTKRNHSCNHSQSHIKELITSIGATISPQNSDSDIEKLIFMLKIICDSKTTKYAFLDKLTHCLTILLKMFNASVIVRTITRTRNGQRNLVEEYRGKDVNKSCAVWWMSENPLTTDQMYEELTTLANTYAKKTGECVMKLSDLATINNCLVSLWKVIGRTGKTHNNYNCFSNR